MRLTLFIGWRWLSRLYTTFQWGRLSWLLHLLKQRIPRSEATAAGGEGACLDLTSVSFKFQEDSRPMAPLWGVLEEGTQLLGQTLCSLGSQLPTVATSGRIFLYKRV